MGKSDYEAAIPRSAIIEMMGICDATFDKKHRDRMFQCGAIYKVLKGRPHRIYIMGFPSRVQRYIASLAIKGEVL